MMPGMADDARTDRATGYTVVNAAGAWLADKGGVIGWTTDPSDPDIFTFETADEAAANAETVAGERVAFSDRAHALDALAARAAGGAA